MAFFEVVLWVALLLVGSVAAVLALAEISNLALCVWCRDWGEAFEHGVYGAISLAATSACAAGLYHLSALSL